VTVVVAVPFYRLGAVNVNTAKRVIYLDAILYLMGGILGTAHHWYFTGQSSMTMAIGASFSALEVVPLVLLTIDAWNFIVRTEDDLRDRRKRFGSGLAAGVTNRGKGVFVLKLRKYRKDWRFSSAERNVAGMVALVSTIFSWPAWRFHSRAELELELIALRHQG
jgi:hypothetical protein